MDWANSLAPTYTKFQKYFLKNDYLFKEFMTFRLTDTHDLSQELCS